MRIRLIDQKNKVIKIVPEIADDLWHLEQIIEPGDWISGSTDRKIKGKEEQQKSERVKMFVKIQVENTEFHRYSGVLRVNGIILEGKPEELVEVKSHHSLEVKLGEMLSLKKKEWSPLQIQRLQKAAEATRKQPVLLCVLDDETATFGILKEFDVEARNTIRFQKTGKRFEGESEESQKKYFEAIIKQIQEFKPVDLVVAGPGFSRENFKKFAEQKKIRLAEHAFFESTNSTGITGLNELVQSKVLEKIVQTTQVAKESQLMEAFLGELGKETGLATYGKKEIGQAVQMNAVQDLLVLDSLLRKEPQETREFLALAEKNKAQVHILNSESDAGKKLDGFGGMVAILKFKTKWE